MMMKVTKATSAMPSPLPVRDYGPRLISRGLICEPVMSMRMRARMATMWMRMRMSRKKHREPMIDHRRMWRNDLGTSDGARYQCEVGDDADTDEEEEASQANAGSMQNVED
jgi:hypothetical protein